MMNEVIYMKSNKFFKALSNFIENIMNENRDINISPEKAKENKEIAEIINTCYWNWDQYRL